MRKLLASTALCLVLGAHAASAQSQYSSLTVFGDSLSANGAIGALSSAFVPAAPYYQGRYSNGPVYAEYLNSLLKIPGSFNDYAIGGAYTGKLNETLGAVPVSGTNISATLSSLANANNGILPFAYDTSVQGQINRWIAAGGTANSSAMFVMWGGANDFLNMAGVVAAQPSLSTTQVQTIVGQQVTASVTNMVTNMTLLAKAGAKNFIVPVLPNLGVTPSLNFSASSAQLGTLAAASYNIALANAMAGLQSSLGVKVFLVDTYSIVNDVVANPSKYGLTNVTTACVGTTSVCSNPSSNLFWDSVHPTAGVHMILAEAVTATVNAPLVIGAQGKMADIAVQSIFDGVSSRINALQQGASGFTLNAPGGASGHIDSSKPISAYVTGDFGVGSRNDQVGETGFHYTNGGVQAGAEYRADQNLAFGVQANFNSTGATLKDGMGSDDLRSYGLAGYIAMFGPHWYGSLAGFWAYQDWDKLDRNTNVVGQVANGTSSGSSAGGKAEGGYMFSNGGWTYGPVANIRYANVIINGYTEQGAVGLNESFDNQTYHSLIGELGGEIATELNSDGTIWRPSLHAGWNHQFTPSARDVWSRLASLPQVGIDTSLPSGAKDWARIGAGLSAQASKTVSVAAEVDGSVGRSDGQDVSGMVKVLCNF
jgi:outer membrane lipase/esterase